MIRRISLTVILLLLTAVLFAQFNQLDFKVPVFKSVSYYAVAVPGDEGYMIPVGIANNEHYQRSLQLTALAVETFDFGEYDAAAAFAEEAIREAQLSDAFVSSQLIAEADRLLAWAVSSNLPAAQPYYYSVSRSYYDLSLAAYRDGAWDDSRESAVKSIEILSALQTGSTPPGSAYVITLPSQYTVRSWAVYGDCLWKIAADPGVFGDARRWPELYEANKARMPQPDNPDLIHIGFILNIPGANRSGMWDASIDYTNIK